MEQKRIGLAFFLSLSLVLTWQILVVPHFWPAPPPVAKKPVQDKKPGAAKPALDVAKADQPKADQAPAKDAAPADAAESPPKAKAAADGDIADAKPQAEKKGTGLAGGALPKFPPQTVQIGSIEEESGYRLFVTLTSRGAAVSQIELNDHRYRDLGKGHPPLKLVSPAAGGALTLQTKIPQFGADLTKWDWEVVSQSPSDVTFRMPSADGSVEVLKHYALKKVAGDPPQETASAYELQFDLTFKNKGPAPQVLNYELQGPVGLPLENIDNTQKFRDVVVAFIDDNKVQWLTSKAIAESIALGTPEEWKRPPQFIGVDVQYFAALLIPQADQAKTPYIASSTQVLIGPDEKEKSDVSVVLTSVEIGLDGAKKNAAPKKDTAQSVTHSYRLFAGPKRDDLLAEIGAPKVIDHGMFAWISRPMLKLLTAFYHVFHSYGIAIICLTVLVRSCMFPLSIKQARSAAKMQELQPEIAALKEKYGKDKEKMARAQMELFSKHKYNPFGGCLLVFVQLPVFMGLYQALSNAVDLRRAKFLWIDNLAAPDALFDLPFRVPFFGWNQFNLLPMITIVLFIVQQKMFMPPPTNDEEAMRNKMMNYMMVFMGFMFYKVPAGLCVYFIASSLWGLAERKLLPKSKKNLVTAAPPTDGPPTRPSRPDSKTPDAPPDKDGFFARLIKSADKELSARNAPLGKGSSPGKRK